MTLNKYRSAGTGALYLFHFYKDFVPNGTLNKYAKFGMSHVVGMLHDDHLLCTNKLQGASPSHHEQTDGVCPS